MPQVIAHAKFLPPAPGYADSSIRRMTITTDDQDREGDIVESGGCNCANYLARNPIVLFAHDYSGGANSGRTTIVGRTLSLSLGMHDIAADYEFAPTPFAQEVKTLVDGRFLSTASIGFRSLANEPRDPASPWAGLRHKSWELLEWSIVPVPMNANASAIRTLAVARAKSAHLDVTGWARGGTLHEVRGTSTDSLVADLSLLFRPLVAKILREELDRARGRVS